MKLKYNINQDVLLLLSSSALLLLYHSGYLIFFEKNLFNFIQNSFFFFYLIFFYLIFSVVSWIRNNSSCTKKGVDLIKISFPYLGTSNSKFRLNLTQRVTGSLVSYNTINCTVFLYFSCSQVAEVRNSLLCAPHPRHVDPRHGFGHRRLQAEEEGRGDPLPGGHQEDVRLKIYK